MKGKDKSYVKTRQINKLGIYNEEIPSQKNNMNLGIKSLIYFGSRVVYSVERHLLQNEKAAKICCIGEYEK